MNWSHHHFDVLDSTNTEARRRIESSDIVAPTVISASTQTNSVGRRGRPWVSIKGNLLCTLVMEEPPLDHVSKMPFVVGLVLMDTIRNYHESPDDIRVKWPNDIMCKKDKVAGILIERFDSYVIIGIGANLKSAPDTDQAAAALNIDTPIPDFINYMTDSLDKKMAALNAKGFESLREKWLHNAYGRGQSIVARFPNGESVSGVFDDIDRDGRLLLNINGNQKTISTADIFVGLT